MAVKKKRRVTKKKITPRKKVVKDITIKDMKSWLSGVIAFQDKDWTPNAEQWKAILDKINNLVNDEQHERVIERIVETRYVHEEVPYVNPQQHQQSVVKQPVIQQPVHQQPDPNSSLLDRQVDEQLAANMSNVDAEIIKSAAPAKKTPVPIQKSDGSSASSFG